MPYILSPLINKNSPGLWGEGQVYESENLYSLENEKHPPVNYDSHKLKPHSLTHMESSAHTQRDGETIEKFFVDENRMKALYGQALVVRLRNPRWEKTEIEDVFHFEVTKEELKEAIYEATKGHDLPNRIIITVDKVPVTSFGIHDPNYVLTLDNEAAEYLISNDEFIMYGTSWKSTDFNPGQRKRPIHDIIFKKAAIFENLKLDTVPAGFYFFVGLPLPLVNASESPVCPALFTKEELVF